MVKLKKHDSLEKLISFFNDKNNIVVSESHGEKSSNTQKLMEIVLKPIDLGKSEVFNKHLKSHGKKFQNIAETGLRLPKAEEMNSEFITYKKTDNGYEKESSNIVTPGKVVARNLDIIGYDDNGNAVYNEWLIDKDVVQKNYGDDILTKLDSNGNFTNHSKIATITAIELTSGLAN